MTLTPHIISQAQTMHTQMQNELNPIRLKVLTDWFDKRGETHIADSCRAKGLPVAIYCHPDKKMTVFASFCFLGIEIKLHPLLPNDSMLFSWEKEF